MGVHRYLHASRWNWWNQIPTPPTPPPLDPTVVAFNSLTGTNFTPIQTMVASIKAAGFWDKLTDIYPFVGLTASSQAVNLKNPGTNSIAFKAGGTYNASGMKPSGAFAADDMLATPPLMVGVHRSFSCGAYYSNTIIAAGALSIRLVAGNGIFHAWSDGMVYPEIYGTNQGISFSLGQSKMVSLSTNGGFQGLYSAGAYAGGTGITGNSGSAGVNASIGSGNTSTFSVVFFGYTLDNIEQETMYSICNAYNSSMGR